MNFSPVKDTVVTNDRWGKSVRCKHGGFLGCSDRYNPGKRCKHGGFLGCSDRYLILRFPTFWNSIILNMATNIWWKNHCCQCNIKELVQTVTILHVRTKIYWEFKAEYYMSISNNFRITKICNSNIKLLHTQYYLQKIWPLKDILLQLMKNGMSSCEFHFRCSSKEKMGKLHDNWQEVVGI